MRTTNEFGFSIVATSYTARSGSRSHLQRTVRTRARVIRVITIGSSVTCTPQPPTPPAAVLNTWVWARFSDTKMHRQIGGCNRSHCAVLLLLLLNYIKLTVYNMYVY